MHSCVLKWLCYLGKNSFISFAQNKQTTVNIVLVPLPVKYTQHQTTLFKRSPGVDALLRKLDLEKIEMIEGLVKLQLCSIKSERYSLVLQFILTYTTQN